MNGKPDARLTDDQEVIACPYIGRPDAPVRRIKIDHLEFKPSRKRWSLKRILNRLLGKRILDLLLGRRAED